MVSRSWKRLEDYELVLRDVNISISPSDAVRLAESFLVADEMGSVNSRTREDLSGRVWAKKQFLLPRGKPLWAELCFFNHCDSEEEGVALYVEVNGNRFIHRWTRHKDSIPPPGGGRLPNWSFIKLPGGCLKEGLNEALFHSDEGVMWNLFIENSRWPNRSAKSIDGGKTWDHDVMGFNSSCNGEYVVRLRVGGHPPRGAVTSQTIDLASLALNSPIRPLVRVHDVALSAETSEPEGTRVLLEAKMGSSLSYSPDTWTAWTPVKNLGASATAEEYPRYLEWRATLATDDMVVTPELREVRLEADVQVEETWPDDDLRVVKWQNARIARSSFPFAYQRSDESRLQILRERYQLGWMMNPVLDRNGVPRPRRDQVEFDKLVKLGQWVREQWLDGWKQAINWGGRLGYLDYCPPWDAPVIIELAKRRLSQGMCTHYSTVFVQFCLAVGLQARHVILSEHCVAEVWSNEYGKWVMMDVGGDMNDETRVAYYFEKDGVPLSALEVHNASLKGDLSVMILPEKAAARFPVKDRLPLFDRFCIALRNDHLTSLEPGEPEHGAMYYHYDGYLWWRDEKQPAPWYTFQSDRVADLYWTLNTTEIHLQKMRERGCLRVELDTVTPNLACFLVQIDDGEWVEKPPAFTWSLHPGRNALRAKTVNKFSVEGIASEIELHL